MIVFKYFYFKRFSIKFGIWKSNKFFSLHWAPPLKMAQSQNWKYESEKNDTKTGIMQVLMELQQNVFYHLLAQNYGNFEDMVLT